MAQQSSSNNKANLLLPLTVAVSTLMLSACSSTGGTKYSDVTSTSTISSSDDYGNFSTDALLDLDSINELADLLEAKNMDMVENNQADIMRMGNLWDRVRSGFRLNHSTYNQRIEAQKSWFITRQEYIDRLTARASRYLYHTIREAERRNIPTELALLPVIESSYDPTATSNAAAAGMWQFIPSTGKMYGLDINSQYDGRRDVIESTRAAYDFLTDLYNRFGSWELALAAYNCGPTRVQRAINSNKSRGLPTDFWSLDLPTETENYVPRFMAVGDIIANPSGHGIYLKAIANQQHFRTVPVANGVSLYEVSQLTGLSSEELKNLNPGLTYGQITASSPQRVVVPNSTSLNMDSQISALGTGVASTSYTVSSYTPKVLNTPKVSSTTVSSSYNTATQFTPPQESETLAYNNERLPTNSTELANYAQGALIHNSANNVVTTNNNMSGSSIGEPPISASEAAIISQQVALEEAKTKQDSVEPVIVVSDKTGQQATTTDVEDVLEQTVMPVTKTPDNVKLDEVKTQQDVLEEKGEEKKLSFAAEESTPVQKPSKQPKGERSTYTVQSGDILSNIASRAGVNWRDIADWNQMKPDATLLAGSTIYLYDAKPIEPLNKPSTTQSSTDKTTSNTTYKVKAGDTLLGVANRQGVNASKLAAANDLSITDNLYIGQTLTIPNGSVQSEPTNKTTTTNVSSSSNKANVTSSNKTTTNNTNNLATVNYKVSSGDTLTGIANKFDTSKQTLADLNGFSTDYLVQLGQTIKVPETGKVNHNNTSKNDTAKSTNQVSGQSYKVKSGDTLLGVANRQNVSASQLATANGLTVHSNLQIGQTLIIPTKGESKTSSSSSATKTSNSSNSSKTGGSTTKTTSSSATTNMTSSSSKYTVKSGDSLTNLAKRYNMSISQLATANGLSNTSQVQIGQVLTIPATTAKYKVSSGDSLIGLAKKYGISTQQLADMNGLTTNAMLQIGQTIVVPVQ